MSKTAIQSYPKKIYLQVGGDDELPLYSELSEVTHCEDKIDANDVEYVRADIVEGLIGALEEIAESHPDGNPLRLINKARKAIFNYKKK